MRRIKIDLTSEKPDIPFSKTRISRAAGIGFEQIDLFDRRIGRIYSQTNDIIVGVDKNLPPITKKSRRISKEHCSITQ